MVLILPKQSSFITNKGWLSLVEFISSTDRNSIPKQSSSSLATVVHLQLRLFIQISRSSGRVSLFPKLILSPVYSPVRLFSRQFILKSSSIVIPSENEEFNSLYSPAAFRDLFSPVREYHKNIAYPYIMACAYASYSTVSFILRTSLFKYMSCIMALHTTNSLHFRKK